MVFGPLTKEEAEKVEGGVRVEKGGDGASVKAKAVPAAPARSAAAAAAPGVAKAAATPMPKAAPQVVARAEAGAAAVEGGVDEGEAFGPLTKEEAEKVEGGVRVEKGGDVDASAEAKARSVAAAAARSAAAPPAAAPAAAPGAVKAAAKAMPKASPHGEAGAEAGAADVEGGVDEGVVFGHLTKEEAEKVEGGVRVEKTGDFDASVRAKALPAAAAAEPGAAKAAAKAPPKAAPQVVAGAEAGAADVEVGLDEGMVFGPLTKEEAENVERGVREEKGGDVDASVRAKALRGAAAPAAGATGVVTAAQQAVVPATANAVPKAPPQAAERVQRSAVVAVGGGNGSVMFMPLTKNEAEWDMVKVAESGTRVDTLFARSDSNIMSRGTEPVDTSAAQRSLGEGGRIPARLKPRQLLSKPTMPWPARPVDVGPSSHGAVTCEADVLDARSTRLPAMSQLSKAADETGLASVKSSDAPPLKVKLSTPYHLRNVEQRSASADDKVKQLDPPSNQSARSYLPKHATRSLWPQAENTWASAGRPARARPVLRKEGATTEDKAKSPSRVQLGGESRPHGEATGEKDEEAHQTGVLLASRGSGGSKRVGDEVLRPLSISLQAHGRPSFEDATKVRFEAERIPRFFGYDNLQGVKTYTAGSKTMRRKAAPQRKLCAKLTLDLDIGAAPLRLGSGPVLSQAAEGALPSVAPHRVACETPTYPSLEQGRGRLMAKDAEAKENAITPTHPAEESEREGWQTSNRPPKVLQAGVLEDRPAVVAPLKDKLCGMSTGAPKLGPQTPSPSSRAKGEIAFERPLIKTLAAGSLSTKPSDKEDAVPGADRFFGAQEIKEVLKLQAAWRGHETRTWIQAAEIVRGMQWAAGAHVAKHTKPHTSIGGASGFKSSKKEGKGEQQTETRKSALLATQAKHRRNDARKSLTTFATSGSPRKPPTAAAPRELEEGGQCLRFEAPASRGPPAVGQAGHLEGPQELPNTTEQSLEPARRPSGPGSCTGTSPKKSSAETDCRASLLRYSLALQSASLDRARSVSISRQDSAKTQCSTSAKGSAVQPAREAGHSLPSVEKRNGKENRGDNAIVASISQQDSAKSQLSTPAKGSALQAARQAAQTVASVEKDDGKVNRGDSAVVVSTEEPQEPPLNGSKLCVANPETKPEDAIEEVQAAELKGGSCKAAAVPGSSSSAEEVVHAAARDSASSGAAAHQEEAEVNSQYPAGWLEEALPVQASEESVSAAYESPDVAVHRLHAMESAARRRHHAPSAYAVAPFVSRTKPLMKRDTGQAADAASVEQEEPPTPKAASPLPKRNPSRLGKGVSAALKRAYSLFGRDSNGKHALPPKQEEMDEPHVAAGWIRGRSYTAATPDPIDASHGAPELEALGDLEGAKPVAQASSKLGLGRGVQVLPSL
ncbi:hypothetical protein Esti_006287 [Eimeria stiedai]